MCMAIQVSARGNAENVWRRETMGRIRHAAGAEPEKIMVLARGACERKGRSSRVYGTAVSAYVWRARLLRSLARRRFVRVCMRFHGRARGMARRNTARPTNFWRLVSIASAAATATATETILDILPRFRNRLGAVWLAMASQWMANLSIPIASLITFRVIFRFRKRMISMSKIHTQKRLEC